MSIGELKALGTEVAELKKNSKVAFRAFLPQTIFVRERVW
jgi:hypothetical protein